MFSVVYHKTIYAFLFGSRELMAVFLFIYNKPIWPRLTKI